MWFLIITLMGTYHYNPAPTSVEPFTSEQTCLNAGNAYIKSLDSRLYIVHALCVYQGNKPTK
jgi:hypothetical protein